MLMWGRKELQGCDFLDKNIFRVALQETNIFLGHVDLSNLGVHT